MALLQTNPAQQQAAVPEEQESTEQTPDNETIESAIESSGATVDADQISGYIMENMDEQQQTNAGHFIDEGKKLLFGEETHYQLMDSLKNSKDIPRDLGYGAYQLMISLIQQGGLSAQNRPDVTAAIIPSGVILMALVSEFMNASNEFPDVTIDQFGNAADIFANMMMRHDPEYMQRMEAQGMGEQQQPQQQGMMQPQGGLLNQQQGV